ncbi:hypothetical protein chiPu_0027759, partial [Chiloscyllium punctatum]|nr:hypothetical protein [Chiloscyllium punctatum]
LRQRIGEQMIQIGRRRALRHVGRLDLAVQEIVDLVMEDQRQAGDA